MNDDFQAGYNAGYNAGYSDAIKYKKIKGKWRIHDRPNLKYGCNLCGNLTNMCSKFCPNCGAYMETGAQHEQRII